MAVWARPPRVTLLSSTACLPHTRQHQGAVQLPCEAVQCNHRSYEPSVTMDLPGLLTELLVLGVTAGLCLYAYFSWKLNQFKRKGIPYVPGYPIVGNNGPWWRGKVSAIDMVCNIYNELKDHRFGGTFPLRGPKILIRDPELIKLIFVKNFDHFVDRGVGIPEEADILLGGSIFTLQGKKWKMMRDTLTPAFTSSKMKNMFMLVSDIGQQLRKYLDEQYQNNKAAGGQMLSLEMRDLWARFTNDVIATAGFGVQCDSLQDPSNEFHQMGKLIIDVSGIQGFKHLGYMMSWRLMKFLRVPLTRPRVTRFMLSLVRETIATREREGIVRPDMIHLLILARRGELRAEEEGEEARPGAELSDAAIAAQVWNFFFAGIETTTTLLSFVTNLLAVHGDIQTRLQAEIDSVLRGEGNTLSYEGLQRMKYLDMVISETLRLYPPVLNLDRDCRKRYTIPATETSAEFTLNEGDGVWVAVIGLHMDPEHFPEPEKFDPERFSDENKHNIKPYTYMPFGVGPRNCIGMRLALMEAKVALVYLLSRFRLHVVDRTQVDIKLSTKDFNITVEGGFWVGLTPREKSP